MVPVVGDPLGFAQRSVEIDVFDLGSPQGDHTAPTALGRQTHVENGRPTLGYVDAEGQFCSFWPPDYRACYELRWLVEDERIAGLRFRRGSYSAVGRYQFPGSGNAVKE